MVYIHRHSSILRLDLFGVGFTLHGECRSNSLSTKVLLAAILASWVSAAATFACMCRQNPVRGQLETFPLPEKTNTIKCFAYLRLKYEGCIAYILHISSLGRQNT